ncbi:hypothetical protein WDW86_03675 [Bdellovibrionota bacterium FG-2]
MKAIEKPSLLSLGAGLGTLVGVVLGFSGCMGLHQGSSVDGTPSAQQASEKPYVEAFFEFPGPQEKWAGPPSFILHVVARDAAATEITVTPELYGKRGPQKNMENNPTMASDRRPASQTLTSQATRDYLATIATNMQTAASADFSGCLYPVRVRLVRSDGALLEKQGCRSQAGWARSAGEAVNYFVTAMHWTK